MNKITWFSIHFQAPSTAAYDQLSIKLLAVETISRLSRNCSKISMRRNDSVKEKKKTKEIVANQRNRARSENFFIEKIIPRGNGLS